MSHARNFHLGTMVNYSENLIGANIMNAPKAQASSASASVSSEARFFLNVEHMQPSLLSRFSISYA